MKKELVKTNLVASRFGVLFSLNSWEMICLYISVKFEWILNNPPGKDEYDGEVVEEPEGMRGMPGIAGKPSGDDVG